MFKIDQSDYQKLLLPRTFAANPCDNDGVLSDSEPHIQACIIGAVASTCGLKTLNEDQLKLVRSTFGQADNIMSMDLFGKISADTVLGNNETLRSHTRESFVDFFIEARRAVWEEWTSQGRVAPKPFAREYLKEFRTSDRLFGLVTGMPFQIAGESVKNILKANDILPFTRDRRVCCDDPRLEGKGKPDPLCYILAINHFVEQFNISPQDMWVIEDRANGAVAALRAEYNNPGSQFHGHKIGKVVVIPDEHDALPVEFWDKKELMQSHLVESPQDRSRLAFLRSLEDLIFSA